MKAKERDMFEPHVIVSGVYVLTFIVPAVPRLLGWVSDVDVHYYIIALFYACLSLALFLIAYGSRFGQALAGSMPQLNRTWHHERVFGLVIIYSVIGFGGFYVAMQSIGGIDYYLEHLGERIFLTAGLGYLFQLRQFAGAANFLWFVSMLERKRNGEALRNIELFLYIFHLIAVVTILFGLGSRGTILSVALLMLLAWNFVVRRIRLRILMAFYVTSSLFAYIYGLLRSISITELIYDTQGQWLEKAFTLDDVTAFMSAGLADGARMVAGIIESAGGTVDYQWGRTYWNLLYLPIPRSLFESKPKTGGEVVTEEVFYATSNPGYEYLSPTLIGEAYLNFHFLGIILVSLILGIVTKAAYAYTIRKSDNVSIKALVGCPLLYIIYLVPMGEFINSMSDLLIKVGINVIGILFVTKKAQKISRPI